MKSYLVMGLFALYVVVVSLVRYLREDEFFRLTAMKRLWGRSRGLVYHFLANVALPMVLGVVFLSQAAVHDATRNSRSGNLLMPKVEKVHSPGSYPAASAGKGNLGDRHPLPIHHAWEAPAP